MAATSRNVREWRDVDLEVFRNEIVPEGKPAVLRSLVQDWPAVAENLKSTADICEYIRRFDSKKGVHATVGSPSIKGRFFYRDDFKGFNFDRKLVTVSAALDNLVSFEDKSDPPAIALQAIPVPDVLPDFERENVLSLVDESVAPRMWLGNRTTVAAHYDVFYNIACVIAGRRRFTLFPPSQVANLYVGPLLSTPGGSPISMVELERPDLSLYPRFEEALAVSQEATLEPGDAIYIPILWWHSVASLDRFNVLINYWWNEAKTAESPFHSLLQCMLSISALPADQRRAWRDFFDYFVFQTDGDPSAHLPDDLEDILGPLDPEKRKKLMGWLWQQMRP